MKILFKLATRSRPRKFEQCLININENILDKINFQILVSSDNDDELMQSNLTLITSHTHLINDGEPTNKIGAINRDIERANPWDILINTSDDMLFTQKGFDDIIRADMQSNFPDLDGFLHYNDGNQKSNVCTMSIMGRKYYERFNYIYHPSYKSVWCDVEQTEVAHMLGKYKYMGDEKILFRHMHPAWGLGEWDEQYRKSEDLTVWGEDLKTLLERRARNYDLKPEEIVNPFLYSESQASSWKRDLNATRVSRGMEALAL